MKRYASVTAFLLGLIILVFGGYMLVVEMQKATPHSGHVYLFAAMMAFGALLIVPAAIGQGLTIVINAVGPYLPQVRIGGRRAYDPPAMPVVAPGEPFVERGDESGG